MSRFDELIYLLTQEGVCSDDYLCEQLNINKITLFAMISMINSNERKYKQFAILRTGKRGNHNREISNPSIGENMVMHSRDKMIEKGIGRIRVGRKQGIIGLNTRQGKKNRNNLISSLLESNLKHMIEISKLLN
jgi:hypothetical protein